MKYVVLLRGINVGKKKVEMARLKALLERMGFENVKTLLNSGNVVLEGKATVPESLVTKIEEGLQKEFGFSIDVIIRAGEEIQKLVASEPFKQVKVTPQTRLYVTFLSEKPNSTLKIPHKTDDFTILKITDTEVCSFLTISTNKGTTDVMKLLEKEFGKKITTRNWNTVFKISKL